MKPDHSPVSILPPPRKLRDIQENPLADPPEKKPPGCCGIIVGFFCLFLVIALPGYILSSHLEKSSLPAETPLQRKVRLDLEKEEEAKQRGIQEALERIRQRQ
jgi:hypothetical protein